MWDEPDFSLHFALARKRARQEVFVFILHLFTGMPQMVVAQRVRCEGFWFFKFTAAVEGVHGGGNREFVSNLLIMRSLCVL